MEDFKDANPLPADILRNGRGDVIVAVAVDGDRLGAATLDGGTVRSVEVMPDAASGDCLLIWTGAPGRIRGRRAQSGPGP